MPRLRKIRSRTAYSHQSCLIYLAMRYFIGLQFAWCVCYPFRVFALIPILHKSKEICDSVYYFHAYYISYLAIFDIFVYYRNGQTCTLVFSRFTTVVMYDNPAHDRILALIRHQDPRISIKHSDLAPPSARSSHMQVHSSSSRYQLFQVRLHSEYSDF